mmetsp:Transcript_33838/g.34466  ORF Transcript_33838/g.34466 Transcript_33838/m.34466 type:complete len:264 (-) Transcript_33838:98-889(-)
MVLILLLFLIPLLALIIIAHVYFLPQYLVEFVQFFFYRKSVIFFRKIRTPTVSLIQNKKPKIALTIDDSPTQHTESILDILKKYNIHATFFIISSFVKDKQREREKDTTLQRMIREGHELGNHGSEDIAAWRLSKSVFHEQLLECEQVISQYQSLTNKHKPIKWYRPGHGIFTSSMLHTLQQYDYTVALGNVYPHDANGINKLQCNIPIINAWYLRSRIRPGCIVVIHDRLWTITVLEKCLEELSSKYEICTLSELMQNDHYN